MCFTVVGDEGVIMRLSSNGLLTLDHAKHDVDPAPIIIVPEPVNEVEPGTITSVKQCPQTAGNKADTMSTGDEEQSLGLNGRLRPRKPLAASPSTTKVSRKSDGKSPSGRPKRNTNTSYALPSKLDDLANKSDSFPTSQLLCPYCDKKFASKQNVIKHVRRLHMFVTKQEATISCLFCNHAEADFDIVRHMVDSHPNQYFACLDCHSRFNSTTELAEHKLGVCEKHKPNYNTKPRQKNSSKKNKNSLKIGVNEEFRDDSQEYSTGHGFKGIVISCELKPSQVSDDADIEDNITTNLILPHNKSLGSSAVIEKNAVIVLDDLQWNKRIPPNFSFQNTDADQILSRLGVVHRSPRTADASRRDLYKIDDSMQKFEKCFDTSFYSKVASNVQENLSKFLDGSFNFNPDPDSMIKTRKSKNSVVINTAEGFPILLVSEQFSRNVFDGYMPRAIAPKHKWKWENQENDRSAMNPDQIKRDAHTNNCIITLISSLDIWTQLSMRKKFEDMFNISPPEKKTEKQLTLGKELKEILESRELPAASSQIIQYTSKPPTSIDMNDFPASLGLQRVEKPFEINPAVLSGEWVRPRCYVCCACGAQTQDSKALSSHITTQHPNAQVQHYEIVGELLLNADILKHLYVPPSQMVNRTRPLRGFRDCTKCKKPISLEDLHQHMLDCAGDTPAVRRKCRHHRPFGVRRRRTRLPDNTIRKKMRKDIRTRQMLPKPRIRSRTKIRSEVGDAETIRKMLADLPAKRHRSSVNPTNLMLRPPKRGNIQRNKFLIKRRSSEEHKLRRLRSSRQASNVNQPLISASNDKYLDPDEEDNKPLKPRSITNKTTRTNEPAKKNNKMNRARRKSLRTIGKSNASVATTSDAPSIASDKPTEMLSSGQSPQKIDVNTSPYNTREHANRGGNNSRDDQRAGGSRSNDNANNAPAPNIPLKHSIARLTADSERHDKSVQFHHLFLVQQEYNHDNSTAQHGHTQQPVFFENEVAVTKLDKPPLPEVQKTVSDLQKCKFNKPRKGLNDCIAMLKNKLGDAIPSATHVSVQCGSDEPIEQYVNEEIEPILSSPIYEKPNGILEPTCKTVQMNFTKPLDPPTVPSPAALSPTLPPQVKSLRSERSLRYHRKSLPDREVLPKPKRSTRRNTLSENKLEKQNTSEPEKQIIAVLPKPSKVSPKSITTVALLHDSSLDIIPLPVKATHKPQIALNVGSEKVEKIKVKLSDEQSHITNDISTTLKLGQQLDTKDLTCSKRSSEVSPKTLQNTASGASKYGDHLDDQSKAKAGPLVLATSPMPVTQVTRLTKTPPEIPQAHSNVNVESILAVPLDLSGKISKINLAQIPITLATDSNEQTDNGTLDLSKKNVHARDVIVDLRKKPTICDKQNKSELSSVVNEYNNEITDLSCSEEVHLYTPTDLSIRGKHQPLSNKMVDLEVLPKISISVMPTRQSEKVTDAISASANVVTSRAAEIIRTKISEIACPVVDFEATKSLTAKVDLEYDFSRLNTTPLIELNKDGKIMSPSIMSNLGSTNNRQPEIYNSDSSIINDFSMPKHGATEIKHINHMISQDRTNRMSKKSDNHDQVILQESHDSSLNKGNECKVLPQTSPDSKQLKLSHPLEAGKISEPNLASFRIARQPSEHTSEDIPEQKLPIQSTLGTDIIDFTAKAMFSAPEDENEFKKNDDKSNYLACKVQKPVYDPTLRIPQYKIRVTSNATLSLINTSDVPNYAPIIAGSQKSVTPLLNDSQNRFTENLAAPKALHESTLLTSHYGQNDRSFYRFANGPLNSLGSLPAYTTHNRTFSTPSTKHESTKPVYTLPNACISVTKIDPSSSATLTNTLLSIPGSTIASTMPVYTLTGTTIGAQIDYSIVSGQGSQTNPEIVQNLTGAISIVSRDIAGMSNHVKSHNAITAGKEYREKAEIGNESKPLSINNTSIKSDQDPETARKIAMLPKELVDILGTMPIDHRNQLLNILPQYVSTLTANTIESTAFQTDTSVTKRTLSSIEVECNRKSSKSEASKIPASRCDRKPVTLHEQPSSLLSCQNSVPNIGYSNDNLENNEDQNKLEIKDKNINKIIDLTEEDSLHSTPDGLKQIEDLRRNIVSSIPQQNLDQEGIKMMQKGSNDKTSSLRAVRIKTQIERNKSMSIITQTTKMDITEKCTAEIIDATEISNPASFSILAIQQAEVTSTQHKNNLKSNNITPPPTTPSPNPSDDNQLQEKRQSSANKILENVYIGDKDVDKHDDLLIRTERLSVTNIPKLVHENIPILGNDTKAANLHKTYKSVDVLVTKSDEEDSDDDISLAVIVKQKQNQQKDLKPGTTKKKYVGMDSKKKKVKKIKNNINDLLQSKVKRSLLLDDPKITVDDNMLDENIKLKSPDSNNVSKSLNAFENSKVNLTEQRHKTTKRKKIRRVNTTSNNNCESLQNQKSVQDELDLNKENKVCKDQQNSKSNEINVSEDSKKEIQLDQECKKAILRTENDKNDNEMLDGNKKKINHEDKTHLPVGISSTSNIKIAEDCMAPKDSKNSKLKSKMKSATTYASEELKEICLENDLNNKSTSLIVKEIQQTKETQEKNAVVDLPNSEIRTDLQETNLISNFYRSNNSGLPSSHETSNVSMKFDSQDNNSIPFRRSRRGKSLVDLSYQQDEEDIHNDAEQNIPIPKKRLIFTKLLQDEENIVRNTTSQNNDFNKTTISDDAPASPFTKESHTILDDSTKQHIAKLDKIKSAKRKRSPQVKRKPKKKKSMENPIKSNDTVKTLNYIELEPSSQSSISCQEYLNLSKESTKSDASIVRATNSTLNSTELSPNNINLLVTENTLKTSAEKRKLNENVTNSPTSQSSKPKKCKFSDKVKSFDINKTESGYNLDESELTVVPENRTACYNMPVAIRRTRSKSAVFNTTSEDYDPYDIDQDEMIDIAEPEKRIHQLNKNSKTKTQDTSKKKNAKRIKNRESPLAIINAHKSEIVNETAISNINIETIDHVRSEEIDSDDSSKSDVPLKQLVKEKDNKLLVTHKDNDDAKTKISTKKQIYNEIHKNRPHSVHDDNESKQHDTDEQLRSEQFMESFGFFSERKPRKSNLLASKKISETFHIIANESDDVYFGLKEKAIKKSLHENVRKSTEVDENSKFDDNPPKKAAKRGRKKKSSSKPTTCYCCTCKKEFRRPDNYLRHQMTLLHVSKLSEIELKLDTVPVVEEPNYLIAFKQYIDKLKVLTNKISRDKKSLKSHPKFVMPTLDEILADVNRTMKDQQLSNRGLSNDEALFLDCCELLKESHNPDYVNQEPAPAANTSNDITCESQPATQSASSNLDMLGKTFPSDKVCDTKSDGDVDSITAKNILESEEVRNLENDLISGLKEAASASHNYHSSAIGSSTPDENTDVFSSPNETYSHFEHMDDLDDVGDAISNNDDFDDYPVYKEKMYPDIEEIDMFEDKFDKIKRKCRSQAAAANKSQVTVEQSASIKARRRSKSEKKKTKKSSKKIHKSMVLTKAALKGFDGIKVSIPTSDINMSAIVPADTTGKKKKKTGSKKKRNKANSESSSKPDSDECNKASLSCQAQNLDVYEFMDNEDAELFELRPSTLMERFKRDKETPSTSTAHNKSPHNDKDKDTSKDKDKDKNKDNDKMKKGKDTDKKKKDKDTDKDKKDKDSAKDKKDKDTDKDKKDKDTDKDKAENSSDDNDDFVYMSDDYRGSDHETENSQMSCETASGKVGGEGKKTSSPSKRKDAVEKNAVMGKIFKHNAVRSDKKSAKAKEPAKPKANLDQLFDSLLHEEPSTSTANTEEQMYKKEKEENPEKSPLRFDQGTSSQDDIKSVISDDSSSSSLDKPSTSKKYKTSTSNEHNDTTSYVNKPVSTTPVPFDIYGPSTSKAYDEFLYGASTSYDIINESESSPEYKVPSPSEDSDTSKKKKQKLSKERSNRVNEGASTSFDTSHDSGVARQRERRKCTVGKQNVLAETWSSESEPDGAPQRPRSAESVLSGVARKKKGKKKESHHARRGKNKKQESESRVTSSRSTSGGEGACVGGSVSSARTSSGCPAPASAVPPIVPVAGPSGVARPRARASSFWSSEGEEDHVQQHGWIVGDSHKKLVTMLAHAKGRKRNTDDKRNFE